MSWLRAAWRFWREALRFRPDVALIYGYQDPVLLVLAFLLRARGTVVLSMNDSKFDDYGRRVLREALKALFLVPYQGILAATPRAADYVRFLGKRRVELYACAIDTGRVAAGSRRAFREAAFEERYFLDGGAVRGEEEPPGAARSLRDLSRARGVAAAAEARGLRRARG